MFGRFRLQAFLLVAILALGTLLAACADDDGDNGDSNGDGLPGEAYDGAVIFADYG